MFGIWLTMFLNGKEFPKLWKIRQRAITHLSGIVEAAK
jgi:hypothetical protein